MGDYLIETERLGLRLITKDDVDNLLWMYSDPDTMKFFMKMLDRQGTLDWMDSHFDHYKKYGLGYWAVEIKETKTFIGRVGFMISEIEGKDEVQMGWSIHSKYWNKGYATEASIASCDYAFKELKVDTIYATLDSENIASVRIAEKVGMTLKKHIEYKGIPNTPLYSISSKK